MTIKVLIRRQARWLELLRNYNFTIKYYKRKENKRADAFSRRLDHKKGIKKPELVLLRINKNRDLEYNL